jgi:hypothetical protein
MKTLNQPYNLLPEVPDSKAPVLAAKATTGHISRLCLTGMLLLGGSQVYAAENLSEAFTEGKLGYSFRWRYEHVDQDGLWYDATAIPLRARINFKTADLKGFSAFAELDYVYNFGLDSFNAGGGNTPRPPDTPVIPDPQGGDLNQGYLQYKAGFGQFRLGRQRIIYDNARFVGNVGWRQNEQTYDSFSYHLQADEGFNLQYAYVNNVNTIFGDKVPLGDQAQNTNLLNAAWKFDASNQLTGYFYDIDNEDIAVQSNQTWGFRYTGGTEVSENKITYAAEYARQQDTADNPVSYSANYWRADVGITIKSFTPYLGYESMGGDDKAIGKAFRTPLATLHAFDGWADKFLATPDAGINDAFAGVKGSLGKWKWNAVYHDFSAESGNTDFGTELDASITRGFADNFNILIAAAFFDGDTLKYQDTNKVWVQVSADF